FNDVWIFDENNIWAVGWVGILPGYENMNVNIMRWNGVEWKVFPFDGTSNGIEGIWALDSSNIYFASGGVRRYKNGVITPMQFDFSLESSQGVHRLWGSSESNIWGVGPWGTIVHYDGSKWTKLDFDTEHWYFYDVTGSKETGIAYAFAKNHTNFHTAIVELKDGAAQMIFENTDPADNYDAWSMEFINEDELWLASYTVWRWKINEKKAEVIYTLPSGYAINSMARYSSKDVYLFGSKYQEGARMVHYNGKRFTEFSYTNKDFGYYAGSYAIDGLSILTAFADNKAYLVKVKRRNN
ncbi:MAG TPA: hypothetical protein VHP30_03060, partial [Ignavibacteriales bacterium]|nr:hypothetical protein [Ignavibacteriales bacterium]